MPKEGHPTLLYVKLNIFLVSYSFSFLMLLKPNCPYRHAKEVIAPSSSSSSKPRDQIHPSSSMLPFVREEEEPNSQ
jgi:hypothetical protein